MMNIDRRLWIVLITCTLIAGGSAQTTPSPLDLTTPTGPTPTGTTPTSPTPTGTPATAQANPAATATSAPTNQSTPSLPNCTDQARSSFCLAQIGMQGLQYCRLDFMFGRLRCCGTCRDQLKASSGLNDQEAVAELSVPQAGCTDGTTTSGTLYTNWCVKHILGRLETDPLNCWQPPIQSRCLKTCGLC